MERKLEESYMLGFARVNKRESSVRNQLVRAGNRDYIYSDYTGHTHRSLLNDTLLLKATDCSPYLRKVRNKTRLTQSPGIRRLPRALFTHRNHAYSLYLYIIHLSMHPPVHYLPISNLSITYIVESIIQKKLRDKM